MLNTLYYMKYTSKFHFSQTIRTMGSTIANRTPASLAVPTRFRHSRFLATSAWHWSTYGSPPMAPFGPFRQKSFQCILYNTKVTPFHLGLCKMFAELQFRHTNSSSSVVSTWWWGRLSNIYHSYLGLTLLEYMPWYNWLTADSDSSSIVGSNLQPIFIFTWLELQVQLHYNQQKRFLGKHLGSLYSCWQKHLLPILSVAKMEWKINGLLVTFIDDSEELEQI